MRGGQVMDPNAELTAAANVVVSTFESMFVTEYANMVALAAAVSGSRVHAEDIAQEAMTRLDRDWAKIQSYSKPGAWLRRVTINLALSQKRRLKSEALALLRVGTPEPELQATPGEDEHIWKLVSQLSKKQRAVVALHFLEDQSLEQIAEILEISASTARVHLHRAKQSLHDSLTQTQRSPSPEEVGR